MSFFSKLFNSGELVKEVGSVVDNLTTTNEEKLEAKKKLKEWLKGEITLRSYGTDKYGRVLGDIFCEKGNVAELLKKENFFKHLFKISNSLIIPWVT